MRKKLDLDATSLDNLTFLCSSLFLLPAPVDRATLRASLADSAAIEAYSKARTARIINELRQDKRSANKARVAFRLRKKRDIADVRSSFQFLTPADQRLIRKALREHFKLVAAVEYYLQVAEIEEML